MRRSGVLGERDCAIFSRRRVRRPTQYPYTSLFKFRLRASDAKIGIKKVCTFWRELYYGRMRRRTRERATSAKETPLESVEY